MLNTSVKLAVLADEWTTAELETNLWYRAKGLNKHRANFLFPALHKKAEQALDERRIKDRKPNRKWDI